MSTEQVSVTAVQEGLDALFVAAGALLVVALLYPPLRENTTLAVGVPLSIGVLVTVIAAIVHWRR